MNTRLLRGFLVLIAIIFLLLVTGYVYQTVATRIDLKKYPPIGLLIEVDGLNYHLNCIGEGSPTIILEAGLGESSLSWFNIQTDISKTTKVCSYDRSGFGWSEGKNKQISSREVANRLHNLLETASVTPPYVLVGHSRGGVFVRNFHQLFPEEVVGMILVDSTHENSPLLSLPYLGNYYRFQKVQMQLGKFLAPFGIFRFTGLTDAAKQNSPLPSDISEIKTAVQSRSSAARAFANEIFIMQKEGLNPQTPKPKSLGNLPLVVLSAANNINVELAKKEKDTNSIALTQLNFDHQKTLAELSTNSQWLQVENSGHYIMWNQPEIVLESILNLLDSEYTGTKNTN